jgi:hypothetical protein
MCWENIFIGNNNGRRGKKPYIPFKQYVNAKTFLWLLCIFFFSLFYIIIFYPTDAEFGQLAPVYLKYRCGLYYHFI